MALTDSFKRGNYLLIEGKVHLVLDRAYKTQGRQGGLIILKMKNLDSGNNTEITVSAGTKLEQISPEYKEVQYLYSDDESCYFMDTSSYETVTISKKVLDDYVNFLKEGDKNVIMLYEDRVLDIRRNATVTLEVTESVDAVKGNTANAATKLVTTETGYRVNVPLFVNKGDKITINTETGEYTGRA